MRLIRNARALSRFSLALLLLVAVIIGALLSYLWVIGYYESLDIQVPEVTTITITNATFVPQDATSFNVTFLNPSFSPSDAEITKIEVSTEDGVLHRVKEVNPSLPYRLARSSSETFRCSWNWGNYTGETVQIIVFVDDGSGATFSVLTPLVDLRITVNFDPAISVKHFNVTLQNSVSSATYVDVTNIAMDGKTVPPENITLPLPYTLHPDESISLTCARDWTDYQGKDVTIAAHTLQGYVAYHTQVAPPPVNLTITEVLFNTTDTRHFNATVQNSELSPTYVNVTRITITMENGTTREVVEVSPPLTYTLHPNASVTFMCAWDWTDYRDKNVTVTIHTLQGYVTSLTQTTPASVGAFSPQSLGEAHKTLPLNELGVAPTRGQREEETSCLH
ncbi:MAG: hypothetical protein ACE5OW_06030 [Candidatus Bathyarchaeia archaeon]